MEKWPVQKKIHILLETLTSLRAMVMFFGITGKELYCAPGSDSPFISIVFLLVKVCVLAAYSPPGSVCL